MRALRRIATPASVTVALVGCSLDVDEFHTSDSGRDNGGLVGNTDAAKTDTYEAEDTSLDAAPDVAEDTATPPPDSAPPADAASDTCTCVKYAGPKCKEWNPPGCGS
jgi:hypothetical protein